MPAFEQAQNAAKSYGMTLSPIEGGKGWKAYGSASWAIGLFDCDPATVDWNAWAASLAKRLN